MLQMAIDAIERGGEASVRVREVSDATGVSFASLYHFFGSREGLVEEALAEIYV
ncbi:MAG: TetR family transcriptional regulator, partial [Actinobacteria bacterium]|nr:TetR family transcriptional regulator [Actinomycetota bacterium]